MNIPLQLERKNPWKESLGEYMTSTLAEYLKDNIDEDVYSDGSAIQKQLENEFTLADLGLEWTFERVGWFTREYSFVRTIFKRDATLEEISRLLLLLARMSSSLRAHW